MYCVNKKYTTLQETMGNVFSQPGLIEQVPGHSGLPLRKDLAPTTSTDISVRGLRVLWLNRQPSDSFRQPAELQVGSLEIKASL